MLQSSAADWSGTSVGEDLGEASGTRIGVFSRVENSHYPPALLRARKLPDSGTGKQIIQSA